MGVIAPAGIVASDATHAFSLVQPGAVAGCCFFFTATGGDAGVASPLKIKRDPGEVHGSGP